MSADALSWEYKASRRQDAELPTQLQQATLQTQGYATYIATMNEQTRVPDARGQGQPNFTLSLAPAPAGIVRVDNGEEETLHQRVEDSTVQFQDRRRRCWRVKGRTGAEKWQRNVCGRMP
ncbi:hypothetical protein BKA70DRAFT_1226885 [Coprinopsis sp. MPI-PUGE-AT-0042]|nr:hypothetical protein BKA70DRAFT_1226885 [Coprinopsis sp. MPI-PUGE-AT-0042]